jgi:hypothetical protein
MTPEQDLPTKRSEDSPAAQPPLLDLADFAPPVSTGQKDLPIKPADKPVAAQDESAVATKKVPEKSAEQAAEKPSEKKSLFDVPDLLNGFKAKVAGLGDAASWLPAAESILPKDETKEKADPQIAKALLAAKYADRHDAQYEKLLGRSETAKYEPGAHQTPEGATFTANARGQIVEFTCKQSSEGTKPVSVKNIVYDVKGELLSYDAPSGHRFTRTTQNDKDGFGNWVCSDAQGRRVPYAGSNAWEWRGKTAIDESGFRTMVGSGQLSGSMYAHSADGTFSTSRYEGRDQYGTFLQTKVSLPDGVEVARNSRLKDGHLTTNPQIRLTESGKGEIRIAIDKDGVSGKVVAGDKPAAAQIPPEAARVADRVIKRISDSHNPVGELSAALRNMDNLNHATLTRRTDGKHQVQLNFAHPTIAPPINASIRGFRPGATHVGQDVSFVLSHTQNGIRLEGMNGFSGSVTGPRGRVRPSWTNGMHIGKDERGVPFVDIDSTVQGPFRMRGSSNRFTEQNFPQESPIRQLMHNPDMLHEMAGALRLFQKTDDVNRVTLRKSAQGQYEVAVQGAEPKHIGVNQKLEKFGVTVDSIDLGSTLSATIANERTGVGLGNMKGMTVNVDAPLVGKTTVTPKKVALMLDDKGQSVVHVEIELKGQVLPFDVPVSKLQEYRQK